MNFVMLFNRLCQILTAYDKAISAGWPIMVEYTRYPAEYLFAPVWGETGPFRTRGRCIINGEGGCACCITGRLQTVMADCVQLFQKGRYFMKKKFLAIVMSLCIALSMLPGMALAADKPAYAALGDSISAGYGLSDPAKDAFSALVKKEKGFELTNLSQSGATSDDLASSIKNNLPVVTGADVITITAGGNDMMNALYAYLAAQNPSLTADAIKENLLKGDMTTIAAALPALSGFVQSEQAVAALKNLSTNLTAAITAIRKVNPDVQIIVATQYNPYKQAASGANALVAAQAKTISDVFGAGVAAMNQAIQAVCTATQCTVADVYTKFDGASENPCNASFADLTKINLDFHPNANGHSLIAEVISSVVADIETEEPVVTPPEETEEPEVTPPEETEEPEDTDVPEIPDLPTDLPISVPGEDGTGWAGSAALGYQYYVGGKMVTGWYEVGGIWYLFDQTTGLMKSNGWEKVDDVWYLFNENGAMLTGWQVVDGSRYYLRSWGGMATGWQMVDGIWYYLRADGVQVTDRWIETDGEWYYLTSTGAMATNEWVEWNGEWYYLYSSGAMAVNTSIDGYKLGVDGAYVK